MFASDFPWFEIFYRILNHIAELLNKNNGYSAIPLMKALYELEPTIPGMKVEVRSVDESEVRALVQVVLRCFVLFVCSIPQAYLTL